MKRLLTWIVVCCAVFVSHVDAEDADTKDSAAANLKANPDDASAWQKYLTERLTNVFTALNADPDAAKKLLNESANSSTHCNPIPRSENRNKSPFGMSTSVTMK